MFKQINNLSGGELYLIASLLIFMVFFILVGLYIFKMGKDHVAMMRELPINDETSQQEFYEKD